MPRFISMFVVFLLLQFSAGCAPDMPVEEHSPQPIRPPLALAPAPREKGEQRVRCPGYKGKVVGLTEKTVTIDGTFTKMYREDRLPGGTIKKTLISYDDGPNPRNFTFHPNLLRPVPLFNTRHCPADLRMGDVINIWVSHEDPSVEYCVIIAIHRRPGGRVPPAIGDERLQRLGVPEVRWDNRMNAEQAWEERGVPIPEVYLSYGRAGWTNPPYPPVAPQPREVKP
jgi:hypothetical protein